MPATESPPFQHRHLLAIEQLSAGDINLILDRADGFKNLLLHNQEAPSVLRGRRLVNLFFENSTRTRTSFELAARPLGATVINFDVGTSSFAKGESLLDTAHTIHAMGVDYIVMRHPSSGACEFLAKEVRASVLNAGDGAHEHPTQALLDAFTIREHFDRIAGLKVTIIGDLLHSRVGRSNIHCLLRLGAEVTLSGPAALLPRGFESFGGAGAGAGAGGRVRVVHDADEAVRGADVVYLLRIQHERQKKGLFPSLSEYRRLFGIDQRRLALAAAHAIVMHPGPVNRGVEIASDVLDGPRSLVLKQVTNGVAVRMAALAMLEEARQS
ncbi:MAG: aspartate carbamoyltransferase catalytic subunit [Phycisphaerales bacterium]